jgi:hypothetical protein
MCNIIIINNGEKEIETPRQFQEHFGFMPMLEDYYDTIVMDYCLCQADIESSLFFNNITFIQSRGDYYVGMLDKVVGD